MKEITIKEATQEVTAWARDIRFEYEGKEYLATLYWGYDGYDITFKNKTNSTPEWAEKWCDVDSGNENLYQVLDNLTVKERENE